MKFKTLVDDVESQKIFQKKFGKVTVRSRCDLEMTFKEFIEIEPHQQGHKGLLTCRSQWWHSFRYQGHQKVTV